jgi:hypothetical protein
MIYWALEAADDAPGIYMPDTGLSDAIHKHGIAPARVRETLSARQVDSIPLQLLGPDGNLAGQDCLTTDLLFWSWIPVFSERARTLCVKFGSAETDFWPCHFTSSPRNFLHLPSLAEDVVDTERSTFLMTIPSEPPLPFHITHLVLRQQPVAACFRAVLNGRQVFSELLVNDQFKTEWEAQSMSGANFRHLTLSSGRQRHTMAST